MILTGQLLQCLGLLLFAAHAWRCGSPGLAAACLGLIVVVFSRHKATPYLLGPALLGMALVFAATARDMLLFRLTAGLPFGRLAVILSAVVAVCLAGGLFALSRRFIAHGRHGGDSPVAQATAFWLTAGLLALARSKAPVTLLLADRFFPGWGTFEILLLALYAAWLVGKLVAAPRTGPIRLRYWSLFSLVFFSQLLLGLVGISACLMTGALHLPVPALIVAGPVYRGGGLFMPLLYLATLFLVGPGWCSHLCYIGAVDAVCACGGRATPTRLPSRLTSWRVVSLTLVIGAAIGLRGLGVATGTAVWLAAGFGLAGVGLMVTLSRKTGVMIHCTMFCPIGLVSSLLGRVLSFWRLRIGPGCDGCSRCARVCRYLALSPADLARGRPGHSCTLCGDCVGVCPGGRIGYRFPGLSAHAARTAYLTLLVSLHAVFLGIARI